MQTVNMTLIHDGTYWQAKHDLVSADGRMLGELDRNLRETIRETFSPSAGTRLKVNMEFDYSTIPYWMTQYHPYYLHRAVEFEY